MNEQFKQLAEQAKLEIFPAPQHGFSVIAGTDNHLHVFAELVVKKCIQICNQGTSTQMTSEGAASMIQQHFGIKE
jgi:hypothetical protein